eukprot:6188247-Pleurochrysis_carterae.AAC.2
MLSRSRTGGGPPSGALATKNLLTEKVEHGGEATMAAYAPAEHSSSSLEYTWHLHCRCKRMRRTAGLLGMIWYPGLSSSACDQLLQSALGR